MAQKRDIKYLNRNFDSFRGQLIEFAKNYFPDSYNDFSPTSPGMMFIEMASYVGDVLSFYQDTQIQESFVQYAQNPANLYNMAYMMGYRPRTTSAARVNIQVSQIVPGIGDPEVPDFSLSAVIGRGTQLRSSDASGTTFLTDRTVDFSFSSSFDPTQVVDNGDGTFTLTKTVSAYSGEVKTTTFTFDSVQRFTTVTIDDTNIIGVLDIVNDDNTDEVWYEVPFLGQETVFVERSNPAANDVSSVLALVRADRRFVTRFNSSRQLIVQFGSGVVPQRDDTFVPSTLNVGLGTSTGTTRLDLNYDPTNFLYTRAYGLAPTGTLRVRYIVGGGVQSNVPANSINTLISQESILSGDFDSIFFNNIEPATGGSDGDSIEEIRQNALRAFNEQGRTVTLQDFEVRAYSLPPSLGSISKVYATQDRDRVSTGTGYDLINSNPLSLSLYILGYDIEGKLSTASMNLKENLKKYLSQFIMMTDSVSVKDAFVINIGVEYEIITYPNVLGREILLECNRKLKDYFNTPNMNINALINLSEIYTLLDRIKGVQSARSVKIVNINGTLDGRTYSQYAYDTEGATRNNTVYPSLDPSIFEVKYPEFDIKGRISNL
jgi:hypothetical protein